MDISGIITGVLDENIFHADNADYRQGHIYMLRKPVLASLFPRKYIYMDYVVMPEFFCFNRDSGRRLCLFHCFRKHNPNRYDDVYLDGLHLFAADPKVSWVRGTRELQKATEISEDDFESVMTETELAFFRKKLSDLKYHEDILAKTGHPPFISSKRSVDSFSLDLKAKTELVGWRANPIPKDDFIETAICGMPNSGVEGIFLRECANSRVDRPMTLFIRTRPSSTGLEKLLPGLDGMGMERLVVDQSRTILY